MNVYKIYINVLGSDVGAGQQSKKVPFACGQQSSTSPAQPGYAEQDADGACSCRYFFLLLLET
jgi:hypothetical protein